MPEMPIRWALHKPVADVPAEVRDRVRHGAEMLDQARPGWHRSVHLDMDMRSSFDDVLGCVYGTHSKGAAALGLDSDEAKYWAGHVPAPDAEWTDRDWYNLTAAWAHEALTRIQADERAAAAQPMTCAELIDELARVYQIKIRPSTWRSYVARGRAPKPLRHIGHTPVWDWRDVAEWAEQRPGQGTRTDLTPET